MPMGRIISRMGKWASIPKKSAISSVLERKKLRYLNNPRKPKLKPTPINKALRLTFIVLAVAHRGERELRIDGRVRHCDPQVIRAVFCSGNVGNSCADHELTDCIRGTSPHSLPRRAHYAHIDCWVAVVGRLGACDQRVLKPDLLHIWIV